MLIIFVPTYTATNEFFIIAGQHRFEAARQWRILKAKNRETVPDWAVNFPCTILKEDLTEAEINYVAGRLQAQASTVMSMTVTDTMTFFAKQLKKHPKDSMTKLLLTTYDMTGKTVQDGKPVCLAFFCGKMHCMASLLYL